MIAIVDPEVCIGCTLCAQICPSTFKMEQYKAVAYKNPVEPDSQGCANQAAEQCPVQAISLKA